jgi:hypothetical protein
LAEHFEDRVVQKSIAVDLALLERYGALVTDLESHLVRQAKQHDPQAFQLLRSIPGVGKVLALTIRPRRRMPPRSHRQAAIGREPRYVLRAESKTLHQLCEAKTECAVGIGRSNGSRPAAASEGVAYPLTERGLIRVGPRASRYARSSMPHLRQCFGLNARPR